MRRAAAVLIIVIIIVVNAGCSLMQTGRQPVIEADDCIQKPTAESTSVLKTEQQKFIINLTPHKYTYEDLEYDIREIERLYSDRVIVNTLCNTLDGRNVYDIIFGNPQGKNQILIFGAMHAREYITSQIVMRQLCGCIDASFGGNYKGIEQAELLKDVTVHFIPMSNPDGVTISQLGLEGIHSNIIRNNISSMTDNYEQWKANANGVDLNRNFDAGWDEFVGASSPSSERYKGTSPGSEPETDALIRLTCDYDIKRAISYHTCGALIYWYYKQEGEVLEKSKAFAESISEETNYPLDADYTAVDAAGYKDWAVYKMGIPCVTLEVGNESGCGIINPVPIEYFDDIWQRNKNVVYATAYNLKYE